MSKSLSDVSYDLAGAAQATARLTATGAQSTTPAEAAAPAAYVRFRAERFGDGPPTSVPPPAATPSKPPEPKLRLHWSDAMAGPSGWAFLMERSVELTGASGAFVVDPQGLVVATAGELPGDGAEAIGSRLAFAFEQADRMGGSANPAGAIAIELGDQWLTGIRITVAEVPRLVVGYCAPAAFDAATVRMLSAVFVRKAAGA